ncbi:MAG: hypothetical protein K9I68_06655 [Bacteroidales bacterium]|nr:hypothetical protein [Bacteroidales bacterium]MCF8338908.1 hypothetical protein [Bacteroidales bacterium]
MNKTYDINSAKQIIDNHGREVYELEHDLGYYPHVTIIDNNNEPLIGCVVFISDKIIRFECNPFPETGMIIIG